MSLVPAPFRPPCYSKLSCSLTRNSNPGSLILSAEMVLRHMGWVEAADLILTGMEKAIAAKQMTYDFARLMEGATQISCSAFGRAVAELM